MQPTTTEDGGAAQVINGVSVDNQGVALVAQPDTSAAVTEGETKVNTEASTEAASTKTTDEGSKDTTAAEDTSAQADELASFAKAKGFNPEALSEGERKALEMARNAEKRMHEATANSSRQLETAVTEQSTVNSGDQRYDELAQEVVDLKISKSVSDFWAAHPEARQHENEMAETVAKRPWLAQDLEALYAVVASNPNREAQLKADGGREALTELAQKQQAAAPTSAATNAQTFASTTQITPQNVYEMVGKNDQEWFEKNHQAISRAMEGKPPK